MNGNGTAAAAQRMARQEWPVFPLGDRGKPGAKQPRAGSHGLRDATSDLEKVREWWADHPEANIGLALGPRVGFVLDVDDAAALARLEGRHGCLPDTLTVSTGRGEHRYFRWPEGNEVRNRTALDGIPGIDVRGSGGYVVAPGSRHESGAEYTVTRRVPLASAPAWLVALCTSNGKHRPPAPPQPAPTGGTRYGQKALEDECEKIRSTPQGSRNHALNAGAFSIGQLVAGGELEEREAEASLLSAGLDAGLTHQETERTVQSGLEAGKGEPRSAPGAGHSGRSRRAPDHQPQPGERPVIRISTDLPGMVDAAEEALLAHDGTELYVRAGALARVIQHDPAKGRKAKVRRPHGLPIISPADPDYLIERLSAAAEWKRYNPKAEGWIPALPHAQTVRSFAARGEWAFPWLEGVSEHPTLRADGTVLQAPGYDDETGVLYRPDAEFPRVPHKPSAEEIHLAKETLLEPIAEFSFVDDSDRAAALSIPLSIVARPAVSGPVPLFGTTAPSPGTGKGLLANVQTIAAGGRPPSVMAWADDRAEQRKLISSVCLEGLTRNGSSGSPISGSS